MIYYALRCGRVQAAVSVARNNSKVVGEFLDALVEWTESPERIVGPNQESKVFKKNQFMIKKIFRVNNVLGLKYFLG